MNETQVQIEAPDFDTALDEGEAIDQDSYHQPSRYRPRDRTPDCGCRLTTEKGAYRDVVVEMPDGRTVYFYHQSPVVVEIGDRYRLDSCGYRTRTTKERINRRLPYGYRVKQRDHEWLLDTPDGVYDFTDGMTIGPAL